MSDLTSVLALKALDGLSLRAEVTAHNIANADSPGYRPLKVSFEKTLTDTSSQGIAAINALKPKIEIDDRLAADAGVRIDLQMASASMSAARYSALVEVLARSMQQMRTAVGSR